MEGFLEQVPSLEHPKSPTHVHISTDFPLSLKAFSSRNGKKKAVPAVTPASASAPPASTFQTNVFSLVERLTFQGRFPELASIRSSKEANCCSIPVKDV
jgi:hypothetical protein